MEERTREIAASQCVIVSCRGAVGFGEKAETWDRKWSRLKAMYVRESRTPQISPCLDCKKKIGKIAITLSLLFGKICQTRN
jgi:hypothetical protein